MHWLLLFVALSAQAADTFAGRWAMQAADSTKRVFWMEVTDTNPLAGNFFGLTGGRLEKFRDASIEGDRLRFHVERTFPDGRKVGGSIDLRLVADKLTGEIVGGKRAYRVKGWRNPEISDRDDGKWREESRRALLDQNFTHWTTAHPGDWKLDAGVLSNTSPKADLLVSRENYWNFVLSLEFKLPKDGNAGIGLRDHYELQLNDDFGRNPDVHGNASLYSQIAPSKNASRPPGEWQKIEVRLVGRDLSVVLNGEKVIDRQQIRGLTGLAVDADETKPGPLSLQGDHGGIEYRNIYIARLSRD